MATRKGRTGSGRGQQPPDGELRRSQLLTTYGPGALVDLVDDAVLIKGLDHWQYSGAHFQNIQAPRLRDDIAGRLAKQGRRLSKQYPFKTPPGAPDKDAHRFNGVRARVFPSWMVCTKCKALVHYKNLQYKSGRYWHDCEKKPVLAVPVRFVAACPRGHLSDFDWMWFCHTGPRCKAPRLYLHEGPSGDFSTMEVRCKGCKAKRRLIDVKIKQFQPSCRGERPWLGFDARESQCDQKMRLIVRTASNAYFSQTVSALTIPDNAPKIHDAVQSVWNILTATADINTLRAFRMIPDVTKALEDFPDDEAVMEAIHQIRGGYEVEQEPLRQAEYRTFLAQPEEAPGDKPGHGQQFFARRLPANLTPDEFDAVVLAHKLREVRAQIGFTRLEPATPNFQGEHDIGVRTAPLSYGEDWLPAIEIQGEGIFIKFNEERLQDWEQRPAVIQRGDMLKAAYDAHFAERSALLDDESFETPPFPGVRFYMLHSFSHLLLTALSLECGYQASSIRERIYSAGSDDGSLPMAGVLLSTGTPGSEGTLGGLVAQGRVLKHHLRRALMLGSLCSNDPVCASHNPAEDHTDRNLDGAACHGCLYISENSCEWFNRHLDRALVVPCIGQDPWLAYFQAP